MKLLLIFYMLYFVQLGDDKNNTSACFSCLQTLNKMKQAKDESAVNQKLVSDNLPKLEKNVKMNINININDKDGKHLIKINTEGNDDSEAAKKSVKDITQTIIDIWNKGSKNNSSNDKGKENEIEFSLDKNKGLDENQEKSIDPKMINIINTYFDALTQHQVTDALISKPKGEIMIDEIYVTGLWDTGFDPSQTKSLYFYRNGKKIKVQTMHNVGMYRYGLNDKLDASIVELPFDDGNGAFIIVLPKNRDGIADVMQKLKNPQLLENAMKDLEDTNIELFLPKFKVETFFDLQHVLKKIGIPGVQLRSDNQKYQKVIIKVNEEGRKGSRRSLLRNNPVKFKVKWPFYYEIKFYKKTLLNGVFGLD